MHKVNLTPQAAKSLQAMPQKVKIQIARKIDLLAEDPRRMNAEKLQGYSNLYRFRSGDYRIVYQIHDQALIIIIVHIAHRREIYRKLTGDF